MDSNQREIEGRGEQQLDEESAGTHQNNYEGKADRHRDALRAISVVPN